MTFAKQVSLKTVSLQTKGKEPGDEQDNRIVYDDTEPVPPV